MPRWNEILEFALEANDKNNKFTLEELSRSNTMIIVSVYDKEQYHTQREGQTVTQEEHRFLGDVRIPLQSILTNPGKCSFQFRLNRPMLLPTYKVISEEIYFMEEESLKW